MMAENTVQRIEPQQTAVAPSEGGPIDLMALIARAATDPTIDIDKMERLLGMHERLSARQAEAEFNEAMAAVQAEMRPVAADANNPQTKSRYASYAALDKAIRPIYTKHGFSLSFDTDDAGENQVKVICHVGRGGFTRSYHAVMPADGKGAKGADVMTKTHATGSAFAYGQRYLLRLIFNVAVGDDDDGNKADGNVISAEQKEVIVALLRETEADIPRFLAWAKADSVDEIKASQFAAVKARLEEKRAKK